MPATIQSPSLATKLSCQLSQGSVTLQISQSPNVLLASSSAVGVFPSGSVDRVVSIPFVVTSGSPYVFNVVTGKDPLANAAGIVTLLAVVVENNSVTTAEVMTVGAGTHPVNSDVYTVKRGGYVSIYNPDGTTIVASTNDNIRIAVASGTNVAGVLSVYGRST